MSEKEFDFERSVYRNTSSLVLGVAIYVTTLGTVNPWLIYGVGIVSQAAIVGAIRGVRQAIKESK